METSDVILSISERGQVTIPQKIRKAIAVKHFLCTTSGSKIILTPLQTREEFFAELDEAENDWKEHGGTSLSDLQKKHNL